MWHTVWHYLQRSPEFTTYVSMLRKYVPSPEHILQIEDVVVDTYFTYEERPEKIVDRKDQVLSPLLLRGSISRSVSDRPLGHY